MTATSSGRRRRLRALVVVALALLAVVAGSAPPAAGHAYLSDSDPGNGEAVDDLPEEVTLEFSGDGVQVADVVVTDPEGEVVSEEPEIDPDDRGVVRVPVENADGGDEEGLYTVEWEILADDGHTTSGSFFFVVGEGDVDREAVVESHENEEESIAVGETLPKAALLIGTIGLVGVPVAAWIGIYPLLGRFGLRSGTADRRLSALLASATALLVAGALGIGLARLLALDFRVGEFLGTPLGRIWLVQVVLAAGVVALAIAAVRGALPRRTWLGGAFLGGLAVTATVGWTSHSATAIGRLEGVAVDAAHVAGAGLWLGGLVVLTAVLPAVLVETHPPDRASVAAEAIRRYSIVALTGVTLAVTTGFVLAAWHAPTADHLAGTLYGATLSAKVALVAGALGLGGFTRFVALRRLERRSASRGPARAAGDGGRPGDRTLRTVRRAIGLEVAVLLGVVVLSGLLTSTPTAVMADHGAGEATVEREFDGGVLELSAFPAELDDRGVVYVEEGEPVVFDVRFLVDGEPVESDREVTALAHNEATDTTLQFDLEAEEDGVYSVVQALPEGHWWEVRISGEPGGSFESEWVDVYSIPEGHDHDEHAIEPDGVTHLLGIGAIVTGVVGSLAVVVETLRFGRRRD